MALFSFISLSMRLPFSCSRTSPYATLHNLPAIWCKSGVVVGVVDFRPIPSVYEKMVQLCSKEDSRPPLAPAFIVKYLLVSFLYSKPSNRQIGQRTPSPQS